MRILVLNWRDIKNPTSGGAEVLTHEIAKRWIRLGHSVTQFSSYFPGGRSIETIDGVRLIREGKSDIRYFLNSVHFAAFKFYLTNKQQFDVVVDEIHGIPFFIPLYARKKKIALICEVAGRIWDTNFPFPFNLLGKFIEKNYFKLYKNIQFLTISNSTKQELERFGVSKRKITVLPMGITKPNVLQKLKKEENATLIFVARLVKAKGIEDAIKACEVLKNEFPKISLWVIGRGELNYESKLKKLVKSKKLEKHVKFFGFVGQSEKFELMGRAHILIVPSIKEGFGLTVPEAGLMGTPAVGYDVEGLRDIIKGNGLLVNTDFKELGKGIRKLLNNKDFYDKTQKKAITSAEKLNWDKTARVALELIEKS